MPDDYWYAQPTNKLLPDFDGDNDDAGGDMDMGMDKDDPDAQ